MAIAIEFNGTDLTIGSNGFSTLNRYIRQVANSADGVMWMVQGPSLAINYLAQGVSDRVNWRFECGGSLTNRPTTSPPWRYERCERLCDQ